MANYTDKVKFTSTGNYGSGPEEEDDVYTVEEFKRLVQGGMFVDYDGFGNPVKDGLADRGNWIKPSRIEEIPTDATHVVWYNK